MEQGFFVLIVIVVLTAIAVGMYFAAQRRKELAAWAQSKGLRFRPGKDRGMDDRFEEFKCLRRGHSRYANNLIEGPWEGMNLTAFDYHYTTGSGKHQSHHSFSAVILKSPVPLKPLSIRREGFFDKITEFFGFDDIDFESAEFSRAFYVRSPDRRWAYDVIHQRMMEYLMTAPNFAIQFDHSHVMAWGSRQAKPADFEAAIGLICGIVDRLPEYLVRQQTQQA